jgi:hypothetical protein
MLCDTRGKGTGFNSTQTYLRIELSTKAITNDLNSRNITFETWPSQLMFSAIFVVLLSVSSIQRNRDSAVGIVTGYRMDGRGVGVRIPVGSKFSLLYVVQTGSWVHPASYPTGMGALSPGVKRQGHEADHSQLVPRSRKRESKHPLPPICLHGVVLN